MKTVLLLFALLGLGSIAYAQKVYYVKEDATGSGISWGDASGDLQAMINKASEGDSIFVSAGTYKPERAADKITLSVTDADDPDNAFVLKKGVKIFGGFASTGNPVFANRNWKDNETILSGDVGKEDDNSDNVYHVVISVGDDKNTVLDGFTITGGMSREVTPFYTTNVEGKEIATNHGGGIYNAASSPTINHVTFSKNGAGSWGGGVYNALSSSPVISNAAFTENFAFNGAGIFNNNASAPEISFTTFTKNSVNNNGGAIDNELSSSPKISFCTFTENFANKMGGAIANYSHSSPKINNSLFIKNAAYGSLNSPVASGGGAMYNNYACLPEITNSTFSGNKVTFPDGYGGSGAALSYNNPDIPGYDTAFSGGKIYNCIFWDDIAPNDYSSKGFTEIYVSRKEGPLTVSNCVIQGYGSASYSLNYTATSFVIADPMFADTDKSDFSLLEGSPAIDVGLNTGYPGGIDVLDTAHDLAGNKRLMAGIVDMGAYEYQGTASLKGFAAKAVADTVNLRWSTGAKVTSFTVQRSDDGTTFTNIGTVSQASSASYNYTDKKPSLVHTNYYRIKQIDTNNDSSFSNIKAITFRYVKTGGTATGNGLTWATASNDLQAMLNKAVAGDEIRVAAGTYKPSRRADALETETPTDRNNAFVLKDSVNIYGGFAASGTPAFSDRNWNKNVTILSGNLGAADSTDNAYHVVISVGDSTATLLDGFTITGGNADGSNSITVKAASLYQSYGGGMVITNSSPSILHITFSGNTSASQGGGMFIYQYTDFVSAPVISNSIYTKNTANTGGGLYIDYGSAVITNALFSSNKAVYNGGGIAAGSYSKPVVVNATFAGNTASYGRAVYNSQSTLVVRNSIVYGNGSGAVSSGNGTSFQYSLVEGINSDTSGNIPGTTNPLFKDAAKGDYALQYFSPVINKGSNALYTGGQASLSKDKDLADSLRLIGATIDMGAYEFLKIIDSKKDTVSNLKLSLAATGDTVFISWSAIVSDTNAVFIVQRSLDSIHFVTVKTVNSNGKPGAPADYNAYDENPANGKNFYRIKAMLFSGKDSAFSTIEKITATVPPTVIRYIKQGASGDGSSWDKASGDLQAMMNTSERRDQVWVAAGVYKPNRRPDAIDVITPGNRHNSFLLKNHVRVYGGFAGGETDTSQRDWNKNITVLSGDFNDDDGISGAAVTRNLKMTGNDENACNVVVSVHDDSYTLLDGFTIRGGNATFINTDPVQNAPVVVEGEELQTFSFGAGMYAYRSSSTLSHVTFTRNECQYQGGGGIYSTLSSLIISNCAFIENNTYGYGGSSTFGGAMYCTESTPVISNTVFKGNMSWYVGGAVSISSNQYYYPDLHPNTAIINCSFIDNTAGNGFGVDGSSAGALFNMYASATILNSLFANNRTGSSGGAIATGGSSYYGYLGTMDISNCTFSGNETKSSDFGSSGGGAISNGRDEYSKLTINNTIIYGNKTARGENNLVTGTNNTVIRNSLVQDHTTADGNGNIDGNTNPVFTDAANGIFTLQAASPVINKGSNTLYPGGASVLGKAFDLANKPRLVGDAIDMGAYEFQGSPLPVTLLSFTAKAEKQAAVLQWQTSSEINNKRFDIERSGNGGGFVKIGSVEGHGTSSITQAYRYTDLAPLKGNNYYRLAQVDFDGQVSYSGIRMVVFGDLSAQVFSAIPNPAKAVLQVQLPSAAGNSSVLQLYNAGGLEVLRQVVPSGATKQEMNVSSLSAGVYILHYGNQSVKVVKQ